jgi:hypothetical protein
VWSFSALWALVSTRPNRSPHNSRYRGEVIRFTSLSLSRMVRCLGLTFAGCDIVESKPHPEQNSALKGGASVFIQRRWLGLE